MIGYGQIAARDAPLQKRPDPRHLPLARERPRAVRPTPASLARVCARSRPYTTRMVPRRSAAPKL